LKATDFPFVQRETPTSSWGVLVEASSIFLNSSKWKKMPCSFDPQVTCTFGSENFAMHSPSELLERCKTVLHPLLHLLPEDDLSQRSQSQLASLAHPKYFDALAHLAVLASPPCCETSFDFETVQSDLQSDRYEGLDAPIYAQGDFTGRKREIAILDSLIRAVYQNQAPFIHRHCPIIAVHGLPGTGKSFLVDHVLNFLGNHFHAKTDDKIYCHKIHGGLGVAAVRQGLFKFGLSLCDKLGLDSQATIDDVLGTHEKPSRLLNFLRDKRFVIYVDDADEKGLIELLNHVPQSSWPCAVVLTSQLKFILQIDYFVEVELFCFSTDDSLELVRNQCGSCETYNANQPQIDEWLTKNVLDALGNLPLAVRLFSEWLNHEMSCLPKGISSFKFDDLQSRWKQENDDITGSSVCGNRGLRATVSLWLHNLQQADAVFTNDAICFLKIMALTDPNDANIWSLFSPEVPFLVVPHEWAEKLPQLHLNRNFSSTGTRWSIQRAINRRLKQDSQKLIPLLSSLVKSVPDFSFKSFLDRIMKTAPLLTIRPTSSSNMQGPEIISMHQLIQNAILDRWDSVLPEFDIILLELLKSRIYYSGKFLPPFLSTYYRDIARTTTYLLEKLEIREKQRADRVGEQGAMRDQPHTLELRIGDGRAFKARGLAGLFAVLDLRQDSFNTAIHVLKNQTTVTLQQLNIVFDILYRSSSVLDEENHKWWFRVTIWKCVFNCIQGENISTLATMVDARDSAEIRDPFFMICDEVVMTSKYLGKIQKYFQDKQSAVKSALTQCSKWLSKVLADKQIFKIVSFLGQSRLLLEFIDHSQTSMLLLNMAHAYGRDSDIFKQASQLSEKLARFFTKPFRAFQLQCHFVFLQAPDFWTRKLMQVKFYIVNRFIIKYLDCGEALPLTSVDLSNLKLRNYLCYEAAEACLNLVLLLPKSNNVRSITLQKAIKLARDSYKCSKVTKANGHINVAYRRALLAVALGADHQFEESMFYFSFAFVEYREYHRLYNSQTSRIFLEFCETHMAATLTLMPPSAIATLISEWLQNGFARVRQELQEDCTENEIEHLKMLAQDVIRLKVLGIKKYTDLFSTDLFSKRDRSLACIDGVLGVHNNEYIVPTSYELCSSEYVPVIDAELTKDLIKHYEVSILLAERLLQGGYFVSWQEVRHSSFENLDLERRRIVLDFIQSEGLFRLLPNCHDDLQHEILEQMWQMCLHDLQPRIGFRKTLISMQTQKRTFSRDEFGLLAKEFQSSFSSSSVVSDLAQFDSHTRWTVKMFQVTTFDQRLKVIKELLLDAGIVDAHTEKLGTGCCKFLKRKTKIDGSNVYDLDLFYQGMLSILLESTNIKNCSYEDIFKFFDDSSILPIEAGNLHVNIAGPLLRICAHLGKIDHLRRFWNMTSVPSILHLRGELSHCHDQLRACFCTLDCPNVAWHQLSWLIDRQWSEPATACRCSEAVKTQSVQLGGIAVSSGSSTNPNVHHKKQSPELFCVCVSSLPHGTTEADIAKFFKTVDVTCTRIDIKGHIAIASFSSQKYRDLALTLNNFVPFSRAKPIAIKQIAQWPIECGIGVTLEQKDEKWSFCKNTYNPGLYITAICDKKGAHIAGLPTRSKLFKVDGQNVDDNMELARSLLVGYEGTVVEVDVSVKHQNRWERTLFMIERRS